MKAPICQPDLLSGEFCSLLGAQDVVERLFQSSDCYSLLLFHLDANDTVSTDLGNIKHDYMALDAMVKGMGGQSVISLMLPVRRRMRT